MEYIALLVWLVPLALFAAAGWSFWCDDPDKAKAYAADLAIPSIVPVLYVSACFAIFSIGRGGIVSALGLILASVVSMVVGVAINRLVTDRFLTGKRRSIVRGLVYGLFCGPAGPAPFVVMFFLVLFVDPVSMVALFTIGCIGPAVVAVYTGVADSYRQRRGSEGSSAEHEAARDGDTKALEQLLLDDGRRATNWDHDGSHPIHLAAASGHARAVELLLEHNADIDAQNDLGQTALHLAAIGGHVAATKVLLRYRAEPGRKAASGKTASMMAEENGHEAVFELLRAPMGEPTDTGA